MTKRIAFIIVLFIIGFTTVFAQVVKSERSSIRLQTSPKKKVVIESDTKPPVIEIISPSIAEGEKFVVEEMELNIVGVVKDKLGVSSLFFQSNEIELPETGIFKLTVNLEKGDNQISIIAFDSSGNYAEKELWINYVPKKITLAEKVQSESKFYGLIIGINNYEDPEILNLDQPGKDAETLYNVLTSKYTFEPENTQLLKDPRREDIINRLDDLSQKMSSNDNLLIFYAGHGWWDAEANIGYWLPSDARKARKSAWFRNSTLVDYLKEIDSKHTLLITDACFGGSIFKYRTAFKDAPKAIEKLYNLPSRNAMTSGTLEKVPDRSSFIHFLINRLSNNQEKYMSAEQLFSSFRTPVINNSDVVPQYGEIQNVGDEGGDFIFIKR